VLNRHVIPIDVILNETPICEHTDEQTAHPLVQQADVIYAIEDSEKPAILLYGKEKLQRIAQSELPEGARILRVGLGPKRQNLDRLLQLVQQAKGSVDYAEPA
jgi:hypothetical protein